jgi:formate/nitrite transporter FocA (FNT family)
MADPTRILSPQEREQVEENSPAPAKVVHAAISKQGEEELERPASSLFWSAVAAGIGIIASVSVSGALYHYLPATPWRETVVALGYPVGFLIVVLGRMQLFTEQTVVAILPFAREPTPRNAVRVARLWAIVFAGNVVGTAAVAGLAAHGHVQSPAMLEGMVAVAARLEERGVLDTMMQAIPAGFIMASVAWIRSANNETGFWVVFVFTLAISLCGFAHVIAGAAEAFLLMWAGRADIGWVIGGFLLPTLAGNIIGGTGLFAVLAHAQVSQEI